MLPFQKTSIYKETLTNIKEVLQTIDGEKNQILKNKILEESFSTTTNLAKALTQFNTKRQHRHIETSVESIINTVAILDLAKETKEISEKNHQELIPKLAALQSNISKFKKNQKKILILSVQFGQGHMSAAKAVKEAIEYSYGYDYDVEIVDFMELISSLMNLVTKKYYENSVKFAPSMYKLIYESSDKNVQIIKLLNQFNYPFVLSKIKKFFEEKEADLLISTYPIWDYLTSEIWKKYKKDAKFISIITDSITVHNSWILADADYHIVANKDTNESLQNLGVEKDKIKTLGFPVRLEFFKDIDRNKFLTELNLNPKNYTVLFLASSQNQRKNQKIIKDLMAYDDKINLIIITGKRLKNTKLEKLHKDNKNIKFIGWTNRIYKYMKAADVIITKAGGATIMECIAAIKPMIITSVIPGQERGNAELIKRYNLGIIALAKDNVSEHVDYVRKHNHTFIRNLKKQSNPKAAIQISEFINTLL